MRAIKGKQRITLQNEAGEKISLTYLEPTASIYRRIQRDGWTMRDGKMEFDTARVMDTLGELARESLLDAEGAEIEAGGLAVKVNGAMNVRRLNELAERRFGSWQDVFAESYPEFLTALAQTFLQRATAFASIPQTEEALLEKNSVRTSGGSSPDVPTAATT